MISLRHRWSNDPLHFANWCWWSLSCNICTSQHRRSIPHRFVKAKVPDEVLGWLMLCGSRSWGQQGVLNILYLSVSSSSNFVSLFTMAQLRVIYHALNRWEIIKVENFSIACKFVSNWESNELIWRMIDKSTNSKLKGKPYCTWYDVCKGRVTQSTTKKSARFFSSWHNVLLESLPAGTYKCPLYSLHHAPHQAYGTTAIKSRHKIHNFVIWYSKEEQNNDY